MASFNGSLAAHGMSLTRYWTLLDGAVCGGRLPLLRRRGNRFFNRFDLKFASFLAKRKLPFFCDKICEILRQLSTIGHHTRRVGLLTGYQRPCAPSTEGYLELRTLIKPFSRQKATSSRLISSHLCHTLEPSASLMKMAWRRFILWTQGLVF